MTVVRTALLLPTAILITLLSVATNAWLGRSPEMVPASAAENMYSGARAMALLERVLVENVPHPVGTAQNRRVKTRIQAWLDQQGIAHEEQRAWGCRDKWRNCAYVENIIATLPGEREGPYVALMAHYDSVPAAPGAGDDMAGVVAILETARVLKAEGATRNSIMLIITDAEETGLHGAEAFFRHHPLAAEVGFVLNVEGSGTRGRSMVLRTATPNAWFMEHYRRSARHPSGSSVANEVFKRMPNDTDFSVSAAASIPGFDFAFAGERNHYHTPNDNAVMLDPRTVQDHGQNLMPMTRHLAEADLDGHGDTGVVYLGAFGGWIQWPTGLSPVLLVLSAGLLLVSSLRSQASRRQLLFSATVLPFTVLVASIGLAWLCMQLVDAVNGTTVGWPAHLWPFRLMIYGAMFLAALLLARAIESRLDLAVVLSGAWWFWWLLAVALVALMPDAAVALLVPLVPAALLLCASTWLPESSPGRDLCQVATLLVTATMLSFAALMEQTQGFHLVLAVLPLIGLYILAALAFARGPLVTPLTVLAGVALLVGGVSAAALPLYSEHRPQHLNIRYIEDADAGTALLQLQTPGEIPPAMTSAADFSLPEQPLYPWSTFNRNKLAAAVPAGLTAPTMTLESTEPTDTGRLVTLRLRSHREAWRMVLVVPAEAGPQWFEIGRNRVEIEPDEGDEDEPTYLSFAGVQSRDVEVTIHLSSPEPVSAHLVDLVPGLPPEGAALLASRPTIASPAHDGDMSVVHREITF